MEVRPLTERKGMFDLYDTDGCLVGKANPGKKVMLADAFYVPERTCRDTDYDTKSITCSECGETTRNTLFWVDVDGGRTVNGHRPRFCSNCGAKVEVNE